MHQKRYSRYEVRAFALVEGLHGQPLYKPVRDGDADLFCIYGKRGLFDWEWVEDVPDRVYGEAKFEFMSVRR